MKYVISILLISCVGCSKTNDLFTVRIAVNDSLMTYSDGRVVAAMDKLISEESILIPALDDTLKVISAAIADSERFANVRYPSRFVVDLQANVTYRLLVKMSYTAARNQCGELRIIRHLPDGRQLELPIIANQGWGIQHYVEIRPGGITLATSQDLVASAPPYEPFDAHRMAYSLEEPFSEEVVDETRLETQSKADRAARARARAQSRARRSADLRVTGTVLGTLRRPHFPQRPAAQVSIPRVGGKNDLARVREELQRMAAEFEKLDVHEGHHFNFFASYETPLSEVFDVVQVVIESLSKDVSIQQAALWDVGPPPIPAVGDGKFTYHTGWSARFQEFSISLGGILFDAPDSMAVDSTGKRLLVPLASLLYLAIEDTVTGRIDKFINYGIDVNGYVFEDLPVYADRYDEERDPRQEHWQDWHGYTPLLLAVSKGQPEIVRQLILRGADVNKASKRYTYVNAIGTFAVVGLGKASQKVPPVYTGGRILTPMKLATEKGYDDIVKILKDAGAEP